MALTICTENEAALGKNYLPFRELPSWPEPRLRRRKRGEDNNYNSLHYLFWGQKINTGCPNQLWFKTPEQAMSENSTLCSLLRLEFLRHTNFPGNSTDNGRAD